MRVRPVVTTTGVARVGRELTPRVFVPEGAEASYEWQRSPRPSSRGLWTQVSTEESYTLTPADRRQRVRVVVRISGPGFSRVTSYSHGRWVRGTGQ